MRMEEIKVGALEIIFFMSCLKGQTLEPDGRSSNPNSTTYSACDFGQVISTLFASVSLSVK